MAVGSGGFILWRLTGTPLGLDENTHHQSSRSKVIECRFQGDALG